MTITPEGGTFSKAPLYKEVSKGAGGVTQWVGGLAALLEMLSSNPSTPMVVHNYV